jgi:hypothetical protein
MSCYAVPPMGACQRNRKKWRPQSPHLYGCISQWIAFSTEFRTPTLLKSIDLQYGQLEAIILP